MKYFFLFILNFLIIIRFRFSQPSSSSLNGDLISNYPYSIKLGYNEVAIFMENYITIYRVADDIYDFKLDNLISTCNCQSKGEKGGIYLNGLFYTSCLDDPNLGKFKIKVYNNIITSDPLPSATCQVITSSFDFYTSSTIRFFKVSAEEELVGVAWRYNNKFYLLFLSGNAIKDKGEIDITNMARDIDCLYIRKHQRTVCVFGIKTGDYEKFVPHINIFKNCEMTSNFKVLNNDCTNHHSRKIREYTGSYEEPENSDIIYYYYVDTNDEAFVMLARIDLDEIENGKIHKIINGCDSLQSSYDIAENKFLGYDVFVCVEKNIKKEIKIQLFKIENDEISFYKGNANNPSYIYTDNRITSEIYMINFVVLKDSLNFGFLSFRITDKAYFTIFNQPTCIDFPNSGEDNELKQFENKVFNFKDYMNNDNFPGAELIIVETNPGISTSVSVSGSGETEITVESNDYINGEIQFIFKVKNEFFESEECTAKIKVNGCFRNCKKCDTEETNKYHQECTECKEDYFFIIDYPKSTPAYSKNCCKENVDCPNFFYFKNDNKYYICNPKCLTCDGDPDKCLTCYNENELKNYSIEEKNIITELKGNDYYFWENENHQNCILSTPIPDGYYLNDTLSSFMPCYPSCKVCRGEGNSFFHNCITCFDNYFKYLNKTSQNCVLRNEVEANVYETSEDGINVLARCHSVCETCDGSNKDQCLSCSSGFYPLCTHGTPFECFESKPDTNYFFDLDQKCYDVCYSTCEECDNRLEGTNHNCLKCQSNLILFNKNCESHCPKPYYELEELKCVLNCPPYTVGVPQTGYNVCVNCINNDVSTKKCIYLGDKRLYTYGDCVECTSPFTYKCNDDFNILDDCYDLCLKCSQSGTPEIMNCDTCKDINFCLAQDTGNCIEKNQDIDYYYMVESTGGCSYKKCYETCKTCDTGGNNLHHNCKTCKDNFQFDPSNSGNCVELCEFFWYIDPETNKFTCSKEEKCPENLPYLTEINKGCVEECSAAFHNDERFFYRYKKTCITKCPENSLKDNLLYACHSLDDVEDIFVYVSNYISQGTYAENLVIYSSDNKKYFHLFNTTKLGKEVYEKSANKVGTSIIDLSNCISTLKQIYGYNDNEVLYIGVLDIVRDDTSAPQFEYTIHNHLGTKLDINYCINNELTIKKSLNQSNNISLAKNILNEYGYDIIDYKKDNPFFCDVCSLFDYDHLDSYDVLLDDRYKYYYDNQEYYFCEDTCNVQSTKIYLNISRVECTCKGKGNFTSYKKQNYQRYQKYSQNCKDSYMQYFKCPKNVFNKNLFKNNIGHYFIFFFIITQIASVFLFYFYSKKPMMSHIHDVLIKRAKKGYENESSEMSSSESNSYSKSGSSRSGSESRSRSGSESGSRSGSKSGSKSGSYTNSFSGSKNSKVSNPPKLNKSKFSFVSIDMKENDNNNNDINNSNKKEENNNNIINNNNKEDNNQIINNEENNNNNIENKNAPSPMAQIYAKRYLANSGNIIDNSYREESYDFKLPKQKRKREDGEEEEEEEEEEEKKEGEEKGENNGENENQNDNNLENKNNNQNTNENWPMEKKPSKKGKKNEEVLPAAAAPVKTELEKFKDESKKFKKFTFIELYWFIIRKKHRFIALFFKKDIYDIFVVKLSLLILSYTIDFLITTLFFFESEIRKLFHNKKHNDPIYIIFMGIFCVLLSTFIMRIIDFLMEYRMNFKKYEILQKYEHDHSNYFNSLNRMIKGFNQKMIIYYSINFVFSLLVWYIVSAFIGTYYNSRIIWLIMIAINFALSNIFPFIYYLIAVLLQYKGIHKGEFLLYKIGMIMIKI